MGRGPSQVLTCGEPALAVGRSNNRKDGVDTGTKLGCGVSSGATGGAGALGHASIEGLQRGEAAVDCEKDGPQLAGNG